MADVQSDNHIITWLLTALNSARYGDLLYWIDKDKKIFYVAWIHKSSSTWTIENIQVFRDWAEFKKKLGEKDERDLKAAFRNALRSKKRELKLLSKPKSREDFRIWQMMSDFEPEPKVRKARKNQNPKPGKEKKKTTRKSKTSDAQNSEASTSSCVTRSKTNSIPEVGPLPPVRTLFNVSPHHQQDDMFSNSEEPTVLRQENELFLNTSSNDHYQATSPNTNSNSFPSFDYNPIENIFIENIPSPLSQEPSNSLAFFTVFNEPSSINMSNAEQLVPENNNFVELAQENEYHTWKYVFECELPPAPKVNEINCLTQPERMDLSPLSLYPENVTYFWNLNDAVMMPIESESCGG